MEKKPFTLSENRCLHMLQILDRFHLLFLKVREKCPNNDDFDLCPVYLS